MPTFFHGWRRKIGVLTLLMALAAIGGWVRGYFVNDSMMVYEKSFVVSSGSGTIDWGHCSYWAEPGPTIILNATEIGGNPPDYLDHAYRDKIHELDYWSIVLPLTLLSAYLLLVKPKPKVDSLR